MEHFVLVADDDQSVLDRARTVIGQEGYIAVTAHDGKEAYKALRTHISIVAAFIDLEMPYIQGIEIVKFMKTDERLRSVPAIVMDDNANAELLQRALAAGAIGSIQKPFNDVRFRSVLHTFASSSANPESDRAAS